ncbi:MAG: TonB-dependent receptor [bacterium]|nr:TonB-dependent receptor [bacterium]
MMFAYQKGMMLRFLTIPLTLTLSLTLLLAAPLMAEELRGRVETGTGTPLEHARVTDVDGGVEVFTDSRGRFTISGCEMPCRLLVSQPRFTEQQIELAAPPAGEVTIVLRAKQELYEEIIVTASRSTGDSFTPVSIASTVIHTEDKVSAPDTLTELVEGLPGVAENGQGGLFQTFSIRGVSRHRVLTLVAGMPIVGERRAGVSTSFVDPLLMGTVDVLRGPASTHWGSGALGGVVQVFPRHFDGWRLDSGYNSFGDESYLVLGHGTDGWSFGFARREARNGTAADGGELNSHFTQTSATLARRWETGGRSYELLALPAVGRDIGKSNTDYPNRRITEYPEESHLLLNFAVTSEDGWRFQAFAHPNELETEVLYPDDRINQVFNEAFDFGANWQREIALSDAVAGRFGVDYFARRGVDAREFEEDLADGAITELKTLDGGQLDEAAAYATLRWKWQATTLQAGTRFTWQQQQNAGTERRHDNALTGFVGFVHPLGNSLELTGNLGTGLRFPNLSERFFTGTTGRGGTIGNPDIEAERSINTDLGLRWYGERIYVGGHLFHMRISDYIERVEIDEDLLTYVNLTSGTIRGLELDGFFELDDRWHLSWTGHLMDGEDTGGQPLADVPTHRVKLGVRHRLGDWESRLQYQFRAGKSDPGSGEKTIPEAHLVSLAVRYQLRDGFSLILRGSNLLDEEYFNSADKKSPVAPGRALGLSLSWAR